MPATPRHLMVRDISQYMNDTFGMSPAEKNAFNNLEIYIWLNGRLPVDKKQLAYIVQVPVDRWSILEHRVMRKFVRDQDGRYHHCSIESMRDSERDKALRRKEHARRAAMGRWHPERLRPSELIGQTQENIEHAPSIGEHPADPLEVSPSRALPLLNPLNTPPENAREAELATNQAPAEPAEPRQADRQRHRSVKKAKRAKSPRRAFGEGGEDGEAQAGAASVNFRPGMRGKQHFGVGSEGENEAAAELGRFGQFRQEIFGLWTRSNPGGPACTWHEQEKHALKLLLRDHEDLTLDQFKQCLRNVAESMRQGELSLSAPPRSWLSKAVEYLQCPLNRFGDPIRKPAERDRPPTRQY